MHHAHDFAGAFAGLRKLLRFGIIERQVYAEVPPRVEYRLTAFGRRFDGALKEIAALDAYAAD